MRTLSAQNLALYLGCEFLYYEDGYNHPKRYKMAGIQDNEVINAFGHFHEIAGVKPLLRKLESMTEEEAKEMPGLNAEDFMDLTMKFDNGDTSFVGDMNTLRWLLSKHFDLFNYIEEGLALDKNQRV